MATAVDAGAIKSNPVIGVRIGGRTNREMLFLDAGQVSRLAEAAERIRPGAGTLVLLLSYGGMRWGEAVALRRRNCDLLRSRITIEESASEVNGHIHLGPTKTHQDRVIVLPGSLRARLAAHMAERIDADPNALLFPDNAGGVLRNSNWRIRVWQPACREAGMPRGLRIHDLRHTAASLMVSAGANVKAVQKALGHASASMTLDRYSHIFTDDLEALATRLDQVLSRANASSTRPPGPHALVDLSA
jgi:integrase